VKLSESDDTVQSEETSHSVWDYFSLHTIDNKKVAQCNICRNQLAHYSTTTSTLHTVSYTD
jgi:hypothetical protein